MKCTHLCNRVSCLGKIVSERFFLLKVFTKYLTVLYDVCSLISFFFCSLPKNYSFILWLIFFFEVLKFFFFSFVFDFRFYKKKKKNVNGIRFERYDFVFTYIDFYFLPPLFFLYSYRFWEKIGLFFRNPDNFFSSLEFQSCK